MDHNLEELAEMLSKKKEESSLTIKWAAVITIIVLVCGGLFGGYVSNSNRLTRLEAQYDFTVRSVTDLKESQARVEILVQEIRLDQQRRARTEKDNARQ
jgi:hypothetical protein